MKHPLAIAAALLATPVLADGHASGDAAAGGVAGLGAVAERAVVAQRIIGRVDDRVGVLIADVGRAVDAVVDAWRCPGSAP